jgi:hypothetical protein
MEIAEALAITQAQAQNHGRGRQSQAQGSEQHGQAGGIPETDRSKEQSEGQRKKGQERVTAEIARETEKGYEQALGKEAVELMRRLVRGEDAGLPDEFYVEEPEELYSIELCPAKFGASTMEKREQMLKLLEKVKEELKRLIPMERLGKPEDVAEAVLFLVSEESNYITGQVLNVNGGIYM